MTTALPPTGARLLRAFVLGWALIGGTMAVIKVGQGAPLPSAGGAAGLPFKAGGLFRPDAGTLAAFRVAVSARFAAPVNDALGFVCTPKTSIQDAIASVTGTKAGGAGRRILLTEGTWDFPTGGVVVSHDDVEIVALSPGNTVFRQPAISATSILLVTGANVRVQGVTFATFSSTATAIWVSGQNCTIDDCRFLVGKGILGSDTSSGLAVRNCEWMSTASFNALSVNGACNNALITGNRLHQLNAIFDLRFNTGGRSVIVGNSFLAGGLIYANYGAGNVVDGNSADRFAASYTLADNTTTTNIDGTYIKWPVASVFGVSLDFALYRGATPDAMQGRLDLAINGTDCVVYMDAVTTTTSPGVTFDGVISAGYAYLRYTTTATGAGATLKIGTSRERSY